MVVKFNQLKVSENLYKSFRLEWLMLKRSLEEHEMSSAESDHLIAEHMFVAGCLATILEKENA